MPEMIEALTALDEAEEALNAAAGKAVELGQEAKEESESHKLDVSDEGRQKMQQTWQTMWMDPDMDGVAEKYDTAAKELKQQVDDFKKTLGASKEAEAALEDAKKKVAEATTAIEKVNGRGFCEVKDRKFSSDDI